MVFVLEWNFMKIEAGELENYEWNSLGSFTQFSCGQQGR
jgi:hypothetical protein